MEPHARYTLVGAVVIGLVCAIVGSMLWISKYTEQGQYKHFTVYFRNHSLSGLQVDGDVSMRGIKVGSVSEFEIFDKDIQLVKVDIKLRAGVPVKTDTTAVISRNLLTGIANIDLIGGSQAAPALTHVKQDEDLPVIPEGTNGLEGIKNSLPEVLDNANRLLASATEFFSPENKAAVTSLLNNLTQISDRVSKSEGSLQKALDAVAGVAQDMRALSQSVKLQSQSVSQSIEIAIRSLSESLERASAKLASTADRYEDPKSLLGAPDKSTLGPGEG